MLSVGVEGHLSRLLADESPWGGSERKGEGAPHRQYNNIRARSQILQCVNTKERQMDVSFLLKKKVTERQLIIFLAFFAFI